MRDRTFTVNGANEYAIGWNVICTDKQGIGLRRLCMGLATCYTMSVASYMKGAPKVRNRMLTVRPGKLVIVTCGNDGNVSLRK